MHADIGVVVAVEVDHPSMGIRYDWRGLWIEAAGRQLSMYLGENLNIDNGVTPGVSWM
jgi:hypothetical protein